MQRSLDLLGLAGAAVLAALGWAVLPPGSVARVAVALVGLLVAPGYLLLQATAGPLLLGQRSVVHVAIALGVSPALVGLLALGTALLPGGLRAGAIVLVVTLASCALAAVAGWRRHHGVGPRADLRAGPSP